MKKQLIVISALILSVAANIAYGDGKFFIVERVPVGVPYQRAIIMYEAGKETLVLQSKYKTDVTKDINSIAWVVPVPGVPELSSMDAGYAKFAFLMLSLHSRPQVTPVVPLVILASVIILISVLIAKILNRLSIKLGSKSLAVSERRIVIAVLVCFFILIATIFMPTLGVSGIDVLKAETVGIYDVKVIKGSDANMVTGWLKENGFGYGQADSKVFAQYVKKGWCFVTAKVNRKADANSTEFVREGLAAPLILRFDAKEAVYPMTLTATAGSDTEILLYVFANHKMDCGERLKLEFAGGQTTIPFNERSSFGVEPNTFFAKTKEDGWYLCKFKGTLKPDQMTEDIVFKQATNDASYREIRWR